MGLQLREPHGPQGGNVSVTNNLYRLARASATVRAARKGPAALAKRQVRRRVYRTEGRTTRSVLRIFKL